MRLFPIALVIIATGTLLYGEDWKGDFKYQPLSKQPKLEVRYTDGSREAFEIVAEAYHLRGELRQPHRLVDSETGKVRLTLEVESDDGKIYSTTNCPEPSRINLYRRGPYFCEIHWLDIQPADSEGKPAPLKGDLALYCYPEKILVSITWHATGDFPAKKVRIRGLKNKTFPAIPFVKNTKQSFSSPLFGETKPLPATAFRNLEVVAPMRYDRVRGCYTIGSLDTGAFQGHFYHHPNRYETVKFRVKNNAKRRKIYVCHENTSGGNACVEGGMLLDKAGHPLPILVQISKNFACEKEEKFYNPTDAAFSETYFPLYLEPGETCMVTSLHLYQNWGRHMVKQFSSLGAWMDYFHSSTGVTETTCYVPFQFAGLPGVAVADFRAMSHKAFWDDQPQHDNIAGHGFLSYKTGDKWQYLTYRGTTYFSTGPNWMDIGLDYLSTDGAVKVSVRTFELPQQDELRNFIHVKAEVLKPITVINAKENFRLLTVATWVQQLRYKMFAASGIEDRPIFPTSKSFPVRGLPLPEKNFFAAVYGEGKGSNAFVIRSWHARVQGKKIGPAASLLAEKSGDIRLLLVPNADELKLQPGDEFSFQAFWLPYGAIDSADTPREETLCYGSQSPRIVAVKKGKKIADFPSIVRAAQNKASFTIQGGRDLIPVIVTGLTDYRRPRIYRKESTGWRPLLHSRVGDLDGVQVFSEGGNRFCVVFLVHSDNTPQELMVEAGRDPKGTDRIKLSPLTDAPSPATHGVRISAAWMKRTIDFRFPALLHMGEFVFSDNPAVGGEKRKQFDSLLARVWKHSEADSLWFNWSLKNNLAGGRLTPNEDDVDLEFWVENRSKKPMNVSARFVPILAGTIFDDSKGTRTWIHTEKGWQNVAKWKEASGGAKRILFTREPHAIPENTAPAAEWWSAPERPDLPVMAVTSKDKQCVFAISWQYAFALRSDASLPAVSADPYWPPCPPGKRVHLRGKIYLIKGSLDDLLHRVRREILPLDG